VVDETTATLLEIKTEGWATGLRLAGLYLKGQKELKRSLQQLSGNSRYIAEYLVAEVLSRHHYYDRVKIKITISELAHLFKQAPAWLIFLIRTLIKKISHALN
jgi:hypothetical protein